MVINVHAGHNPDGKVACGAAGLILESTENRRVAAEVIRQLRTLGHTVYDCTCDDGVSVADVLNKIVRKCNEHDVDLDVSIHFNAGAGDAVGNGFTTGVETLVYSRSAGAQSYAENIAAAIYKLGFRNRGVKERPDLYFLRTTKAPAVLVECCFVDDRDDVQLYNYRTMAAAIVYGITGRTVSDVPAPGDSVTDTITPSQETPVGSSDRLYRLQCGAYRVRENVEAEQKRLAAMGINCFIVSA